MSFQNAHAQSGSKSLPLVFDPAPKKYFIGANSKFHLKQGEQSSLIDRIEVSVDGGDYQPYGDSIQFGAEGKHTLKFRAVNPVNNWSPVQFIEVFVDLTPPTTEAKFTENKSYQDATGLYVALNSTVSLVAQDNLAGVATLEYSWDGANFAAYSQPIPVTKAGRFSLYYRSADKVGNSEAARKIDFVADATPPVSAMKLEGLAKPTTINGRTYVSDSLAFAIESSDDESKIKQIWVVLDDQKPIPYIKPIYFLKEGPHTLKYYSEDNVGNKEEAKVASVYTVSIPPQTAAIPVGKVVNTGGINFATRDLHIKLEAKDNVVGLDRIEVKVDGEADFKPYLEPIRFTSPGLHTVSYRAVDRAGNVEPTRVYNVNIHETAPETTIATAQPLVTRENLIYSPAPNVVTFNVGNSIVGVHQTLVSVNDGPFAPYQGPMTLTADKKIYKISYKSVDKLGNEEQAKIETYHMIGAVPVLDLFVSDGKSQEEQVRTNYLEKPADSAAPARIPASAPAPAAPKKK